jgi:hypothetical protein
MAAVSLNEKGSSVKNKYFVKYLKSATEHNKPIICLNHKKNIL